MTGYVGSIKLMGCQTAPLYWLFCDGSRFSASQYSALAYELQDAYGGDMTTPALPNTIGRSLVGNVSAVLDEEDLPLGSTGGSDTAQVTLTEVPRHRHGARFYASVDQGSSHDPFQGAALAANPYDASGESIYISDNFQESYLVGSQSATCLPYGGTADGTYGKPVTVRPGPYLACNHFICAVGQLVT